MNLKPLQDLVDEARKIAESKYATVEVMLHTPDGVRYRTVWVSKTEWDGIGNVDYIETDAQFNLLPEYVEAYKNYPAILQNMRAIVAKSL